MITELFLGKFLQKQAGQQVQRGTGLQSTAVAQIEGEGDEMSRAGLRFHIGASAATGIAPVQALPTTAAQWLLYNPAPSGVTMFIDRLGEWLVSGTAGAGGTVLAAVCKPTNIPATLPTGSSASVIAQNANPVSAKASQLIIVASQTLASAPAWWPLAWMNPAGTVLGQTQMIAEDIRGKLSIPPGCGLALAVISPTGTSPLYAPCGTYREYATDTE